MKLLSRRFNLVNFKHANKLFFEIVSESWNLPIRINQTKCSLCPRIYANGPIKDPNKL